MSANFEAATTTQMIPTSEDRERFADLGYLVVRGAFSPLDCRRFLQAILVRRVVSLTDGRWFLRATKGDSNGSLQWKKDNAVTSRAFYEMATHPVIMETVAALLGEDVMLWGASIRGSRPGEVHPWHTDIESAAPSAKAVSVWIGLENTKRESSLSLVSHSHRFGLTVQQARKEHNRGREETTNEDVAIWAAECNGRGSVETPEMKDGDALFFDGRLWHASHNLSGTTRKALLLQYATPDTPIRAPDFASLDWPFRYLDEPRPPCILVRGSDRTGANRFAAAPTASDKGRLACRFHPLPLPLPVDKIKGWKPYFLFCGSTPDLRLLSCHASSLTIGSCPHPPHRHEEEEILFLLAGEVDLILPDLPVGESRRRLLPGQFVYYPAHFAHTLETVSPEPANYLMFKWHTDLSAGGSSLAFGQFQPFDGKEKDEGDRASPSIRLVFEGATGCLHKLHCHATSLAPGAGYEPHIDAYDVAILVLEGEVETIGERVAPNGLVFYPAGEPHGMRNPGEKTARYVVFEPHGSQIRKGLLAKLRDPRRWNRKLRSIAGRMRAMGSSARRHAHGGDTGTALHRW